MKKIQQSNNIPGQSVITNNLKGVIDYVDSFSLEINNTNNYSVDYLTALLFCSIPRWARFLMKTRDILVKPFGIKTGIVPEQNEVNKDINYDIGDRAIFFTVIEKSSFEIIMAEDDKHLYFRTSVFVENAKEAHIVRIYLVTLVQFHNKAGRIYFAPVKPIHKLLIKSLLKKFGRTVNSANNKNC